MSIIEARNALCERPVTLNGQKARVTGAQRPFARVVQVESGLSAEWSWGAVERIVSKGGRFQS